MSPPMRILLAVGVLVALVVPRLASSEPAPAPGQGSAAEYRLAAQGPGRELGPAERAAGFAFAPGTAPANIDTFNAAVAASHPGAQRLIGLLDGLTAVAFGSPPGGAAGVATADGSGRYGVLIDLAAVSARNGPRGISRVVLHELGHVVDFALVDDTLARQMDATVPACPVGLPAQECASPPERFAESFAKWATGDIGIDVYLGYRVPPPAPLATWGDPLAVLGG